jgi:maleylpyruvate isomerase
MIPSAGDVRRLADSARRVVVTARQMRQSQFAEPSQLDGWTRAHVLAHIAGSARSRTRLLVAARQGQVGQQYPSEQARAEEIDKTAAFPADDLRQLVLTSLADLLAAVTDHPDSAWDAPGEWLGPGIRPVARVVPSMRRELEYHHVDLGTGYGIDDWPGDFVDAQIGSVAALMNARSEAPAVTVALTDRTLRIGAGSGPTVAGEPAAVLAWLTGRESSPARLRVRPPGPLPVMPALA